MNRPTVLIAGYYGFGNTGDEAILASIVSGLSARVPSLSFVVVSGRPEETRSQHGTDAVDWLDPAAIAEGVRESDLVLVGGGGLFQDYWGVDPSSLLTPGHVGISFYAGVPVLAALSGKPLLLYGLGFGPLQSDDARRMVRGVCEAASFLSVRDEPSRDLLARIGVAAERITLSADAAFALGSERVLPEDVLIGTGIEPRAPIAGVALRPWSLGVDPADWEREIGAALDLFLERTGGTLLFVPFERRIFPGDDDFALASRVRQRLRHAERTAILTHGRRPAETAGVLAGCDLVVAMRLHAGIFAISGGVPSVGIAYDPKVSALFRCAGLADFVEPLAGLKAASLSSRIEAALKNRDSLRGKLLAAAARERRLAETDLATAAAMLESPPTVPGVTEAVRSLVDEALRANLRRAGRLSTELAALREGRETLERRLVDLERGAATAEAALRKRRHEVSLLERQLAETRGELSRIQTSRVWRAANLYWRTRRIAGTLARPARRAFRRLLGAPPSDWVGPDLAHRAAAAAPRPELENRHELVWFASDEGALAPGGVPAAARFFADLGHRVFWISPRFRRDGPASEVSEVAPSLFAVSLRAPQDADAHQGLGKQDTAALFEALDALRRDRGLGATASVVQAAFWTPVAERLARECGWPLVEAAPAADVSDGRVLASKVAAAFPKISIVVVTYDNRDLNRLCLESLAARMEWPNFEIIVVDNGSTDGTTELLEQTRRHDPRVRLILHQENRGFAAASNAGLAAASGDYLVLLNNDTVVTHGSLTALVRHLGADPRLGLVGPVTNGIANEARVDVGYSGMADLPAWAARWMREHDRETFEIRMLALFCVAIPRRIFEEVGALDERYGIGMFEDDDYSRRVRAKGYAIRCARDSFVHHWQMASFRKLGEKEYFALFEANKRKHEEKWGEVPGPVGRAASAVRADPLEGVLDRVRASKGAVVFLPSIGWGIHLFQRPHHLARVFSRLGYVAIFDVSNAADRVDGFREVEPDLFLFGGSPERLHRIPSPLLWAFPYNYHLTEAYPSRATTVYDWIDDLEVFPYDRKLLERNHQRALREATLVTVVARRLHEEALRVRPDALYVPNGVEYERFASPAEPPQDDALSAFLAGGLPVAGYYGALARWFDDDLLDQVVLRRPDWRFVLIGPQLDSSLTGRPLLERANVLWLGPRDYVTLPGYLGLFDVATIPFRINAITRATSPLKLYEYFAAGKPVVTTPMPECEAHPEVSIARSAEEFADALDDARQKGRDPAFRERLRAIGRANSWEDRVATVLSSLAAKGSPPPAGSGTLSPGESPPATSPGMSSREGRCNICGRPTRFSFSDPALYRESLFCAHCLTTSRYRSIARGLLEAFRRLGGVEAESLAELPKHRNGGRLVVYDTQTPFDTGASAYPIPNLLADCSWIDLHLSAYRRGERLGQALGPRTTNQNLERLTFPDASFDIVVTSDVMEHVRLEAEAHREIRRVIRPGGIYLFTVPHFRARPTLDRVKIVDPADPSRDLPLLEPEFHGDANSPEGRALAYRSFGIDLDEQLRGLGFEVEYTKQDFPELGILNTELFLCRAVADPPT